MMKKIPLDQIGFYTLSDYRIKNVIANRGHAIFVEISRAEMILTDKCNFHCTYCQGIRKDFAGVLDADHCNKILDHLINHNIKNIRFSGGEPLLYPNLFKIVDRCSKACLQHIAISSNGYGHSYEYQRLIDLGVNDFSISLDSRYPHISEKMSRKPGSWKVVVKNIQEIAKKCYVTIGMVFNESNIADVVESVKFVSDLGVADIRIITAAQYNEAMPLLDLLPDDILYRHPILNYRVQRYRAGENIRGLKPTDSHWCGLVLDDLCTVGHYHFPCVIYMRQGGNPIGSMLSDTWRHARSQWFRNHDTHNDPICRENCLDVCVQYNNQFTEEAREGVKFEF